MRNSPHHHYRVLVLDDNQGDLDLFQEAVNDGGHPYLVVPFTDAQVALAYIQSGNPVHLVLTDFNMPVNDGIEFIKALRTEKLGESMPVALMSSSHAMKHLTAIGNKMKIPFFTKPATWDEFIRLAREIDSLLQHAIDEQMGLTIAHKLADRMTCAP